MAGAGAGRVSGRRAFVSVDSRMFHRVFPRMTVRAITPASIGSFVFIAALTLFSITAAHSAVAQEPRVTIHGGVRETNPQWYDWTVTNEYTSPIIKIEIPHTNGDSLESPPGWGYEWLKAQAAPQDLGRTVCRAAPRATHGGIPPGSRAKFSMRIMRDGAMPRPGKVRVHFADGRTLTVSGVELPSGHETGERAIVTITLGAVFVILLFYHARRRQRRATEPLSESAGDSTGDTTKY